MPQLLTRRTKYLFGFILALALIGFIDATYLTIKHYIGGPLPCAIFTGCDTVASSQYSTWGPIPVSLLGSGFYLTMIVLAIAYLDTRRASVARLMLFLGLIGFLNSLYLTYLQAFVLKTFCLYCVISALVTTTIFILVLIENRKLDRGLVQG